MEHFTNIKDIILGLAAIVTAFGVIFGALWLMLNVFKTPAKVDAQEKRLNSLEHELALTKTYYTGLAENIRDVKNKLTRIEDFLLHKKR